MATRWLRQILAGFFYCFVVVALACSTGKSTDIDDDDDGEDAPPPAQITDLHPADSTRVTILLAWTVPASGEEHGAAAWYDLRFSESPLTTITWSSATPFVAVPPAKPGGQTETVLVSGLTPGTRYYFGLKCCTSGGIWSELSNITTAMTLSDAAVVFLDANLEAVVREELSKPDGDILSSEMESILELNANARGIVELTGLEHATKLRFLFLNDNTVTDLSPLSGMSELFALGLHNNRVSDLAPLTGLAGLRQLHFGGNQVADLTPLASLPDLEVLSIGNNTGISGEITPLAGLTHLVHLDLNNTGSSDITLLAQMTHLQVFNASFNGISDIGALENLPELAVIGLLYNEITDLSPLVANAGLGTGDVVNMHNNPLSADAVNVQIPALQARGVTVQF